MNAAALAAHRFGFGEPDLAALGADPRGWVLAQVQQPASPDTGGLKTSAEMLLLSRRVLRTALQAPPDGGSQAERAPDPDRRALVGASLQDLQRRWQHVVETPTPVAERWVAFWANHFTVASTKGTMLGMVWPFEREAIRPHAFGHFADLLRAATLHPSMLLYLDNAVSFGPNSRFGRRRDRGLNENLARELLELHTLGVDGGYTQADVTETARLLTGWTVPRGGAPGSPGSDTATEVDAGGDVPPGRGRFVAALHEPGAKQVLGRRYAEGPQAIDALLRDLAVHPSTARHLALKVARHFVADEPPAPLVEALAARYRARDGDLGAMAQALFEHQAAWRTDSLPKFKRPEEWMLSAHRVMRWPVAGGAGTARLAAALTEMGQPPGRAPSPQGWPDRQVDWLAPDALWKRVEWANQWAQAGSVGIDARTVARASLGSALGSSTAAEIERAASPSQALALLLASPDFLRR
jgi:uncharacterized protein (DUF1800 family)